MDGASGAVVFQWAAKKMVNAMAWLAPGPSPAPQLITASARATFHVHAIAGGQGELVRTFEHASLEPVVELVAYQHGPGGAQRMVTAHEDHSVKVREPRPWPWVG
jgi:hypothetical protein